MLIRNDAARADPVMGQQRQPTEVEITELVKQQLEIWVTAQSYFKNELMPLQRNYSFTAFSWLPGNSGQLYSGEMGLYDATSEQLTESMV